jgi:hypothetical protein
MSHPPITEEDLVRAIALMFFDARIVKCEPESYAKSVIAQVRAFDRRATEYPSASA